VAREAAASVNGGVAALAKRPVRRPRKKAASLANVKRTLEHQEHRRHAPPSPGPFDFEDDDLVEVWCLRQRTSSSFLFHECWVGNARAVADLVDSGAGLDVASGGNRVRPIHIACRQGHPELVGVLVHRGADVDAAMEDGRTPAMIAVQRGHLAVAQQLATAGADLQVKDEQTNASLMHAAANNGDVSLCDVLLRAGVPIWERRKDGASPFLLACQQGHLEVAKFFVEACGAVRCVNTPTFAGHYPIHLASCGGHLAVVQYLVGTLHAAIFLEDPSGLTPLDAAKAAGHSSVANYLMNPKGHRSSSFFKKLLQRRNK